MPRSMIITCSLFLSLPLTGCTLATTADPVMEQGATLQGHVMGGQQPVVGAQIYLLAANNTGYPTATTGASKSLLKFVNGSTFIDTSSGPTNGFYYVATDVNGKFSISGDYSCSAGQQVYLYVLGGNPGAGVNSAAGLMAVVGNCPSSGTFATAYPTITINEVTTAAAAYSMSAFAYDALHVSSPNSARSLLNIQNAFANANNIVNLATGTPYTNLPNGNGTGAPNTLDTLGNILASCVNSTGPSSDNCKTLFTLEKTNGNTGIAATDTATAAINIAHNQGSNATALFDLLGTTQAFVPSYTSAPSDFSLPISYTNMAFGTVQSVAVDSLGDVWLGTTPFSNTNTGTTTGSNGFVELSPQGITLNTITDTTNFQYEPQNLLISAEGNAWASVNESSTGANGKYVEYVPGASAAVTVSPYTYPSEIIDIAEYKGTITNVNLASSCVYTSTTTINCSATDFLGTLAPGTNDSGLGYMAVDGLGNFWTAYNQSGTLAGWNQSGALISPKAGGYSFASGGTSFWPGVAVDQNNNIWVGASVINVKGQATRFSGSGTVLASFSEPNMSIAANVAVDGGNHLWLFGSGGVTTDELDSQGNLLQSFGRVYACCNPHYAAFDGSGNLWAGSGTVVTQYIGIATPVVTPMAANFVSPYTTPASLPQ